VRSTSFDEKNDEDFIQCIQQVLEIPTQADQFGRLQAKLAIMDGNEGIIHDIETVTWLKHRNVEGFKPKLDITSKDYLSLLKYALATSIAFVADVGQSTKNETFWEVTMVRWWVLEESTIDVRYSAHK
jgi:hypothetical protein